MNTLKRYVPELVYNEIKQSNYKNKDHLYVICDMIYRSTIYKKQDDYLGFIDIPKYYFDSIIKNYKEYINYLIENDIILSDNVYSKESGKALGYKFNDKYISKLTSIDIENNVLKRRIIKNVNEKNNVVNKQLKTYKEYFLKTFKIDYNSSIDYLDNWFNDEIEKIQTQLIISSTNINSSNVTEIIFNPNNHKGLNKQKIDKYLKSYKKIINKYNSIFISLSSINDGNLFFRKNKTNGRIDTNLTNLKSEYKKFITNKDLYQIDIINSQPFILSLYLNNILSDITPLQRKELDLYNDWTSNGVFYEKIKMTYYNQSNKVLDRQEIKDMMFSIYYSQNGTYTKQKTIFKSIFPFILSIIEKQKENKHNEFAIKLQKLESEICIDIICKELDEQKIKYYTIHDAWLINANDIKQTEKIIIEKFIEKYNNKPELKIEKI